MTCIKKQFEEVISLLNNEQRTKLAETTKDPEILDVLSRDKNLHVRYGVAQNPNTNPETLDYLSQDKSPDIREKVAHNPNYKKKITVELSSTQHEALKKLIASSQDPELRNMTL